MKKVQPAAMIRGLTMLGALALGVVALGVTGCGNDAVSPDDSSTSLSGTVIDESTITTLGAEGAADAVEMMNGHGVPGPLAGRLPGQVPSGCPYDASSGRFVCVDEKVDDDRDVTRSYAFLDGQGNTQAAYDAATTAAINFASSVTESHTGPQGGTSTSEHERNLTASGLEGAETHWTWNGSGSGQAHREGPPPRDEMRRGHRNGGQNGPPAVLVTVDMTMSSSINDVVVPMPRVAGSWPLSGSISETITATFTGGPKDGQTVTRTITVTFDGTQYATLTNGTETITIDLAQRGRQHPGGRR